MRRVFIMSQAWGFSGSLEVGEARIWHRQSAGLSASESEDTANLERHWLQRCCCQKKMFFFNIYILDNNIVQNKDIRRHCQSWEALTTLWPKDFFFGQHYCPKKRHRKTLPISRDVDCSGGMAKKRGAQRKKLSQAKVLDTAAKKNTWPDDSESQQIEQ